MFVLGLGCQRLSLRCWWLVVRRKSWGQTTHQVLKLQAAQFPDALAQDLSVTQIAYAGDLLFGLHTTPKGRVLQQAIVHTLAMSDGSTPVQEAPPGLCVNGRKRAAHQSEFDFMYGERRVECKGTSLAWSGQHWCARWSNIKFDKALFDDLFLALHSPGRIDVLRHDGVSGVSSFGVRTAVHGHQVSVRGSSGLQDPVHACIEILQKMQQAPNGCQHIGSMRTDNRFVHHVIAKERMKESNSLLAYWYKGIPLSDHSPASRGLRLEKVAYTVDQMLHPGSTFSRTLPTLEQRPGARRGADWVRDSSRVEFKSSSLRWDCSMNRWKAHFAGIKFATPGEAEASSFDELWLGLYSPFGLYLFRHSGTVGRSTNGVSTDVMGHDIKVNGPRNEQRLLAAFEVILRKLKVPACELLATVSW